MPTVDKSYSMNPAIARRRAKDAGEEPDADETGGPSDQDQDDLIPAGHELESFRGEPADNGMTITHHTRPKPGRKGKGGKKGTGAPEMDYRGRAHVFTDAKKAGGHIMKLISAHQAAKKKG